jgi:hypothetical protein
MLQYFELELPPNEDVYKGELNVSTSTLQGLGLYFYKKSKQLIIGTMSPNSAFEGPCVTFDFSQDTQTIIYQGQMKNSMKHGLGVLSRSKVSFLSVQNQLINVCDNMSYQRVITQ